MNPNLITEAVDTITQAIEEHDSVTGEDEEAQANGARTKDWVWVLACSRIRPVHCRGVISLVISGPYAMSKGHELAQSLAKRRTIWGPVLSKVINPSYDL